MKVCKSCDISKTEDDYYVSHKAKGIRDSTCKECRREEGRKYRLANPKPPKPKTPRMDGFRLLPEGKRKCADCKEVKDKDQFYKDSKRASGVGNYCKPCTSVRTEIRLAKRGDEIRDNRRKWAEDNREKLRESDRLYREANRDKKIVTEARRRARKKLLPDTLTHEETNEILAFFNGNCALCDKPSEALDHFIPLDTECGGTTKENIIPLCRDMNSSKRARNPFEWAEDRLDDDGKERFIKVIEYLSDLNGLSVEQYREFVFSCFKTKPKNKNIS